MNHQYNLKMTLKRWCLNVTHGRYLLVRTATNGTVQPTDTMSGEGIERLLLAEWNGALYSNYWV